MIKASINTVFVESLLNEDNLLHLAVFMRLKSFYRNSCIYDATYKNISIKSGMSISFLKRHIPFLKDKGWVRMHHGNMVFEHISKIDDTEKKKKRIVVPFRILTREKYKSIFKRLKLLLVRERQIKFEFVKKLLNDDIKGLRQAKRRRLLRSLPGGPNISANQKFKISNQTVGSIIKKSKSTASRLMNWGNQNKILMLEKNIKTIPFEDLKNEGGNGFFISNMTGHIVKQGANYVRFY